MQDQRTPGPLSRYLELGFRIHWEEFPQVSAVALLVYLPLAYVALWLHPPLQSVLRPGGDALVLIPRMLLAQGVLRVIQLFVFILLILRLDNQRRGGGDVWDLAEAFSRLGRVARVDLAYAFGLQAVAVLVLWAGLGLGAALFGEGGLTMPLAFALTAFAVIAPAIRFYFCAYAALLHGDGFRASFRRSSAATAGAERLVAMLVVTYLLVWFAIWQVVFGVFGGSLLGQFVLHAGIMLTSVSYFYAAYSLYLDLTPPLPGEREEKPRPLPPPPGADG